MIEIALEHIVALLIPLFLRAAGGDAVLARQAAMELLASYRATTGAECLLAAEIVAISFATLDNLGKSMVDPNMAITTCLRLRSNANALSSVAERKRQVINRPRKADPEPTRSIANPPAPTTAMQKVRDAIVEAAPTLAESITSAGQMLSRQQRRFLMRKAEQARVAQEREARKAARLAERMAATA